MKERSLDILWIIPHLNEKIEVVENNIKKIENFSRSRKLEYKIVIADGGSKENCLFNLTKMAKKCRSISVFLTLPTIRPTKNKAIKDAVEYFEAKCVGIIDSDCLNLNFQVLENLTSPLLEESCDISIPFVTKSGGRVNRLVCKPMMRLFFKSVSKKISFPLSGIICIKRSILKRIVQEPDYFWDWGGEIQIILRAAKTGKVHQFHFNKLDSKKRNIDSKKEDSFQLMRAIYYESFKEKKLKSFMKKVNNNFENEKIAFPLEEYTLKKIVIEVIEDLVLNKKSHGKTIRINSKKIDFLKLDALEKYAANIYKEYTRKLVNKKRLDSFLKKCNNKFAIQNKFRDITSIEITDLDRSKLRKISKIYNEKGDDILKTKRIMEKYDNWKTG